MVIMVIMVMMVMIEAKRGPTLLLHHHLGQRGE
jgi:hypothetical protein